MYQSFYQLSLSAVTLAHFAAIAIQASSFRFVASIKSSSIRLLPIAPSRNADSQSELPTALHRLKVSVVKCSNWEIALEKIRVIVTFSFIFYSFVILANFC